MYKIICKDGRAKRATFTTVHGTVETPVFMNVGTAAAIKGAVATTDLKEIGCQIEFLRIPADFRCSRLQDFERLRKKALHLTRM